MPVTVLVPGLVLRLGVLEVLEQGQEQEQELVTGLRLVVRLVMVVRQPLVEAFVVVLWLPWRRAPAMVCRT